MPKSYAIQYSPDARQAVDCSALMASMTSLRVRYAKMVSESMSDCTTAVLLMQYYSVKLETFFFLFKEKIINYVLIAVKKENGS